MPTGTGTHPAGTIAASADQRPEQERTPRRLPWPFSFAHLPAAGPAACPLHRIACRIGADQWRPGPVDDPAGTPPPQQITPPTRTASQKQTDTNSTASAAPMTPQPTS